MNKIFTLFLSMIILLPSGFAFSAEKNHVVMLLWRGVTDAEKGFMEYLSNRTEVMFTILDAERDKDQLAKHINSLDSMDIDLVYTFGTTVTRTLLGTVDEPSKFRFSNVPVVFSIVSDPVGSKIISNQSENRNFTGVSHIVPHEVQLKSISKLSDINSIGILYNPLENNSVVTAQKISALSESFNKKIVLYPFTIKQGRPDISSINDIVLKMNDDGIDLAYLPPDSFIISSAEEIVDTMHNQGIATFSSTETPIRNGQALIGIVSRYYNVGQFAAYKAEQVLNSNINISNIPIESLSQYSYIVNIDAAKHLNYYPPVSVLKISELIGTNSDGN
ncbi:ABC transporter substrate binding protein [uncultured Vibrio sp.]|uniref:ABC transporter substrate binding protein n=1 Tax=uncultured Vibrio sp. TaxID=114054 RepID=UPI000919E1F3|nr:ABC transporter substrate binding protein [uncultured Vibrio sp.]OIQ26216.1 MAG: ABC transporter substrate-binding protein [Vibrio sp. MedPE-SWchi]